MTARIRIALQAFNELADLIDLPAIRRFPAAPLLAIHRPQFTLLVGPLVPDRHAVVLQVTDVGVALQEPQQFMND